MRSNRKISLASNEMIYHSLQCWHAGNIARKNVLVLNKGQLEARGYRPCKCCNSLAYHLRTENDTVERFKNKKVKFDREGRDTLIVRTEIGIWKLIYRPENQNFSVYHGNRSCLPDALSDIKKATWHRQGDKPAARTLTDALQYLFLHDQFRKSVIETGGDLRRMNISKKYMASAKRARRKEEIRRVDELFAMLDAEKTVGKKGVYVA